MTTPSLQYAVINGSSAGNIQLTDKGLQFDEEHLTANQWKDGLTILKRMKDGYDLFLADYLKIGRKKFGEEFVRVSIEQLEFNLNDITRAVKIAEIPDEARYLGLNGDHYMELLRTELAPKEQADWAKKAFEHALSPAQLRLSIATGKLMTEPVTKRSQSGELTIHGIVAEFGIWMNQVGGTEGIAKMSEDSQNEILSEISEIVELGSMLREKLSQAV